MSSIHYWGPTMCKGLCRAFYTHDFIYFLKPETRFKLLKNICILEAEPEFEHRSDCD